MKLSHWFVVVFTLLTVGSGVFAEYFPQYASLAHLVAAVAAAVAGALGVTSRSVLEPEVQNPFPAKSVDDLEKEKLGK